ncbi:MAG: hypothetical protein Q4P18_04870 [Methanobrevibacter sp.]|uniref:hypothetical protein n=1 Tax=Methanobrevibacter sp. TaxID=66852 RepID=UPI0026DEC9AC|nr:hypothetical protein [Methanobrevibacter sp.]MDO5848844.1 hypothetical protein [Methanobrevibacter sp.]
MVCAVVLSGENASADGVETTDENVSEDEMNETEERSLEEIREEIKSKLVASGYTVTEVDEKDDMLFMDFEGPNGELISLGLAKSESLTVKEIMNQGFAIQEIGSHVGGLSPLKYTAGPYMSQIFAFSYDNYTLVEVAAVGEANRVSQDLVNTVNLL